MKLAAFTAKIITKQRRREIHATDSLTLRLSFFAPLRETLSSFA
jgi:hypothetical protein